MLGDVLKLLGDVLDGLRWEEEGEGESLGGDSGGRGRVEEGEWDRYVEVEEASLKGVPRLREGVPARAEDIEDLEEGDEKEEEMEEEEGFLLNEEEGYLCRRDSRDSGRRDSREEERRDSWDSRRDSVILLLLLCNLVFLGSE